MALGSALARGVPGAFRVGMTGSAVPSTTPSTYLGMVRSGTLMALLATMVAGRIAMNERALRNAIGVKQ